VKLPHPPILPFVGIAAGVVALSLAVAFGRPPNAGADARVQKPIPLQPDPTRSRWYSTASPWNTPIRRVAVVPSESRRWIDAITASVGGININTLQWTPTVWFANATTPRYTLRNRNGWTMTVPIPPNFIVSPDNDSMALIIDTHRKREYNLFRPGKDQAGRWTTYQAGGVLRLFGSGWWNAARGPWIGRSSNSGYGGGLIRAHDVRKGEIRHALAVALPKWLIGRPRVPATTSDGAGGAGGIPMGARLQLDPAVNVASLGLDPGEEIVARAMQRHGMYVVESTGSVFALYAESRLSLGHDPYPASWSNGLPKGLIRLMRFVEQPRSPVYDHPGVFGEPRR
jgi:hypothetical protein